MSESCFTVPYREPTEGKIDVCGGKVLLLLVR